ncbi:MAG: extracellular solute-binding protein [Candidatus Latescibacteria bacterium]|nr:extracellular solute-binding protein [Candidatus Latescibacterota bacterium]
MPLRLIGRKFVGFERALARQARAFAEAGGVDVEMDFLEVEDLYDRMVARKGCLKPDYDLMLAATDWYPTLCAQKALAPLDASLADDPPQDWGKGGWTDSVLALQRDQAGRIYGLPYHDGPEMLIYRKDLFESPEERRGFSLRFGRPLEPPKTWGEFLEVAQFFTRPDEGLYGTILAAFPDAHNIIYDFFLHLWTRGGEVLDAKGVPAFQGETGVEALTFLRDLMRAHRVTPPDCAEIDSVKSGERFADGSVALMVNWMGFAAFADAHEGSRVRGRVGCGLVPSGDGGEGCSLNIYWCLSIPAGSQRREDAYQFLRWCARPDMDLLTSEEGAIGVRRSTWREFAGRGVAGYATLEDLHARARHLPRVPAFGGMSEVLNEHLDRALNRGGDVAGELQRAARRCGELLKT